MWTISLEDGDWPSPLLMQDASMPVRRLQSTQEFVLWQGSQHEASRRQAMSAMSSRKSRGKSESKPKSGRKRTHASKARPRKRRAQDGPMPLPGPLEMEMDRVASESEHDSHQGDGGSDRDSVDSFLESFFNNEDLDLDLHGDMYDDNPIGEGEDSEDDANHSAADLDEKLSDTAADDDFDFMFKNLSEPKAETPPGSESNDSNDSSDSSDSSSTSSSSSSSDSGSKPEQEGGAPGVKGPRAPRPTGGKRDMESREIFELPGIGQLRFYPQLQAIAAFCPHRNGRHAPDCRIQRTVNPKSSKASGRPIGHLVSWLQNAGQFEHAAAHKSGFKPSFEERKKARALFESLPESETFGLFEKDPVNPDEREPHKV